jgi:hypothetical protein
MGEWAEHDQNEWEMQQYDRQCYHLAWNLLADHPKLNNTRHRAALALEIQRVIEDYIRRQWPAEYPKDDR